MNGIAANIAKLPPNSGSENCLPIGTRLGEFEIRGVIGEGGFGIVYLAFDESLQRTVAIKEYMPAILAARSDDKSVTVRAKQHQETFGKGLRSFINEARLLAQFDHPALIKVYRFWEQNSTGYMAMRYYEGRTLKKIISDDPSVVTEAWLKSVLSQILEALEALYLEKVLHRDISPDNVMVQSDGRAVLLDFGAARQIISDMTQSLTVILKPGYAPVEQYADDDSMTQGPWTDIYSLAAVTYFAVTGKAPATSVGRMIKDPVEPLEKSGRTGFSAGFLAAIDKGLGIRPEDRPQSIAEFRALLGLAATPEPVVPMPVSSNAADGNRKTATSSRRKGVDRRSEPRSAARKLPFPKEMILLGAGVVLIGAAAVTHSLRHHAALVEAEQAIPLPAPSVEQAVDDETQAWNHLEATADAKQEDLDEYLQHYPAGAHSDQVKARIEAMKAASAASASSTPESAAPEKAAVIEKPEIINTTVKVAIKPWGNVFVDGKLKGVSPPLKSLVLAQGKHKIRIDNPNFDAYVIDMDADGKKKVKIEYDFNAGKKQPSS